MFLNLLPNVVLYLDVCKWYVYKWYVLPLQRKIQIFLFLNGLSEYLYTLCYLYFQDHQYHMMAKEISEELLTIFSQFLIIKLQM